MDSLKARLAYELSQPNSQLGSVPGDPNFSVPFGSRIPNARVFLRNHSAKQERTYVKVAVSRIRGAAAALTASPELRKLYNVATYKEEVREGMDGNIYDEIRKPIMFKIRIDNIAYPVPPAMNDEEPPLVQVPEGAWDLLCGNYERMHTPDQRVREAEQLRFANSQYGKRSPLLFVTIDGKRTMRENPFGFIEVIRQTERMEPVAPNTEFLTALDLIEA